MYTNSLFSTADITICLDLSVLLFIAGARYRNGIVSYSIWKRWWQYHDKVCPKTASVLPFLITSVAKKETQAGKNEQKEIACSFLGSSSNAFAKWPVKSDPFPEWQHKGKIHRMWDVGARVLNVMLLFISCSKWNTLTKCCRGRGRKIWKGRKL